MRSDEDMVAEFLREQGLDPQRYDKAALRKGKTPDFRVLRGSELSFFCEVKTVRRDQWLDDQLAATPPSPDGIRVAGGLHADPTFNRLTSDIHTAIKQFDAVNPGVDTPNVLAFVNHERMCDVGDLAAVLTGEFVRDSGTRDPIYKGYSEGRIRSEKHRIHLYLWFDGEAPPKFRYADLRAPHVRRLCGCFGHDLAAIPRS